MSERKFPKLRADGTFSVVVLLSAPRVAPGDVQAWLEEWVSRNETWWFDEWSSYSQSDHILLSDSFLRPPYFVPSEESELAIRFDGTTDLRFWKDWYARLVVELQNRFPTITLDRVVNAEENNESE